jgi:hypothetical protein
VRVEMGRAERVTHARACSGDVAGRGRKRQADGRPGGQGRTVWADWDGRSVARRTGRRTAWCTDGHAGGRPCGRRGRLIDGRPGARTGGQAGGHTHS